MKKCFVDFRTSQQELQKLYNENLEIIKITSSPNLYDAICGHPDIQMHIINNSKIITHKDSNLLNLDSLNSINIITSEKPLLKNYPNNVSLNALNLRDFFIHNLKLTDKKLLDEVKDKTWINVKQGYTKCSCALVSDSAIITSDVGIYNALKQYPIDILGVPTGDIILPGLNYGFIGGTCGLISEDTMAFLGHLKHHSYGKDIENFLFKHNVKPLYLTDEKLIDRGSLLTLL